MGLRSRHKGAGQGTGGCGKKGGGQLGVTNHADKRIRQRVGVPRSAARKVAVKAKSQGIERKDTTGSLRRYLDHVYYYNDNSDAIYVWAEKVYIFADEALITVLNLPTRYKNAANALGRKL